MGHTYRGSNSLNMSRIYKGTDDFVKVYKGSTEVWRLECFVEAGMIFPYVGDVGTVPTGYALCDGTSGTPDLREQFILSTCTEGQVGMSGGSATHVHSLATGGTHTHDGNTNSVDHTHYPAAGTTVKQAAVSEGYVLDNGDAHVHALSATSAGVHGHGTSGTGTAGLAAGAQMPPYYVAAFIMKT